MTFTYQNTQHRPLSRPPAKEHLPGGYVLHSLFSPAALAALAQDEFLKTVGHAKGGDDPDVVAVAPRTASDFGRFLVYHLLLH